MADNFDHLIRRRIAEVRNRLDSWLAVWIRIIIAVSICSLVTCGRYAHLHRRIERAQVLSALVRCISAVRLATLETVLNLEKFVTVNINRHRHKF